MRRYVYVFYFVVSPENQTTHFRMLICLNSVYWTAKLWRMRYLCDAFDDVITENVLEGRGVIHLFLSHASPPSLGDQINLTDSSLKKGVKCLFTSKCFLYLNVFKIGTVPLGEFPILKKRKCNRYDLSTQV